VLSLKFNDIGLSIYTFILFSRSFFAISKCAFVAALTKAASIPFSINSSTV
jgi:hypothetical protein